MDLEDESTEFSVPPMTQNQLGAGAILDSEVDTQYARHAAMSFAAQVNQGQGLEISQVIEDADAILAWLTAKATA